MPSWCAGRAVRRFSAVFWDSGIRSGSAGNASSRRLWESIGMHCTGAITEYGESQAVYRTRVRPPSGTDTPCT